MLEKIIKAARGLALLPKYTRILYPQQVFSGKRVAIVGPAASLFKEQRGVYIDQFDFVIRINKAPYSLREDKAPHQGTRTDILFHSFYENNETGGGPLDFELYRKKKIRFVVNPRNTLKGWRMTFNFYKKYLLKETTYLLPARVYKKIQKPFGRHLRPTVGFAALQAALESPCSEVFITGFTFFKTPYAPGYRDHLLDVGTNRRHLLNHGIHDPDLEFSLFLGLIRDTRAGYVHFDQELTAIIASHRQ